MFPNPVQPETVLETKRCKTKPGKDERVSLKQRSTAGELLSSPAVNCFYEVLASVKEPPKGLKRRKPGGHERNDRRNERQNAPVFGIPVV